MAWETRLTRNGADQLVGDRPNHGERERYEAVLGQEIEDRDTEELEHEAKVTMKLERTTESDDQRPPWVPLPRSHRLQNLGLDGRRLCVPINRPYDLHSDGSSLVPVETFDNAAELSLTHHLHHMIPVSNPVT